MKGTHRLTTDEGQLVADQKQESFDNLVIKKEISSCIYLAC